MCYKIVIHGLPVFVTTRNKTFFYDKFLRYIWNRHSKNYKNLPEKNSLLFLSGIYSDIEDKSGKEKNAMQMVYA